MNKERKTYLDSYDYHLREWDKNMRALKEKVERTADEQKKRAQKELDALKAKGAELRKKMEETKQKGTDETWDVVKRKLEKGLKETTEAMRKVKEKFK